MPLPPVLVGEIPADGLTLSCEVQPEDLGISGDDARFRGQLALSLTLHCAGHRVTVNGTVEGASILECDRCLQEYDAPLSVPVSVEYAPEDAGAPPASSSAGRKPVEPLDEGAPDQDAEEGYTFSKGRLDLSEMLREQIILALPMHPLCSEDCLGLCPVCGQNRNRRQCGCVEARPESPFAVLKKLRAQHED
jgi:uncharacterized protein